MALLTTIGGNGALFVGEDKTLRLELLQAYANGLPPDANSVPVDMTGWVMVFDVRQNDNSAAPAIVSVTPAVLGVYNAVRSVNTQRATVVLNDDMLNLFKAKTYRHSWKRLDEDSETVLAWGDFTLEKATAP